MRYKAATLSSSEEPSRTVAPFSPEETRARLAAIVESSDDAIIGETLEGIVTTWNHAAQRLYGFTAEEAIGRSITITVPPDRMRELHDYMARVRRGDRVDHMETVRLRKDGSRLDVSITVSPIRDDSGNIIGLSKSSRDITERRRFEAELWRKNVELELANRAKDSFLASMSHELRTPLNSIIGFTGTMLMKLPGPLTTDQEKQLRTIQTSSRHLLSLINDLLDLAKIESGKVELNMETITCRSVIEDVASTLRALAEAKHLKFDISVADRDLTIRTDRRSFTQILINLTNNAIKFTDKGSVRIELQGRNDNGNSMAEITVADTGIGIRTEDQARLFQAFMQVDSSSTRPYEGTGLGLHVSQKLASMIGGHVSFKSEYGKGSRFTISVPALEEAPRLVYS